MSESEPDSDSDSMMRSMMGFSSFGTQRLTSKKASDALPSTGSNAAPVAKKAKTGAAQDTNAKTMGRSGTYPTPAPVSQTRPETSTPSLLPTTTTTTTTAATTTTAHSAPGATKSTTTTFQSTTSPPAPSSLPGPAPPPPLPLPSSSRTHQTIAYTSPTNPSYNLTPSELSALRSGRPNARGDTVYFKPGFIDENQWKALPITAR